MGSLCDQASPADIIWVATVTCRGAASPDARRRAVKRLQAPPNVIYRCCLLQHLPMICAARELGSPSAVQPRKAAAGGSGSSGAAHRRRQAGGHTVMFGQLRAMHIRCGSQLLAPLILPVQQQRRRATWRRRSASEAAGAASAWVAAPRHAVAVCQLP